MESTYEQHVLLSDSDFRRLTGVHKTTSEQMVVVLSEQRLTRTFESSVVGFEESIILVGQLVETILLPAGFS